MAPHPIIVQILHDDRAREINAILASQQPDEPWKHHSFAPALSWWRHLAIRIGASLDSVRGLGQPTPHEQAPPLPR